jgi:hypothetical protein
VRLPEFRILGGAIAKMGLLGAVLAVLWAWCPLGIAQQTYSSTPTQLLEARAHYEEALAIVARPLRERYIEELEQLQNTAYSTKNFDLAKAVARELEAMGSGTGSKAIQSPKDFVRDQLIHTTWVWASGETITFLEGGKAKWSNTGTAAFTWEVTGVNPAVVEGRAANGHKFWMTLGAGLRAGDVVEGRTQRATSQIDFRF